MADPADPADSAGPSQPTMTSRTSTRTRVKSQRAIESEDTNRLIARAKAAQMQTQSQSETGTGADPLAHAGEGEGTEQNGTKSKGKAGKSQGKGKANAKARGKGKGKGKEEVWCICRSSEADGPMIECGECNDWFHFSCVGLEEDEAERIHKYICPNCEETTGEKSTNVFDITTFRSPSPPPGLPPTKKRRTKRESQPVEQSDSGDNHIERESEASASDASSHASDRSASPPKRQRREAEAGGVTKAKKPRLPSISVAVEKPDAAPRKQSATIKTKTAAALPGPRQFALDKLPAVIKALLVDLSEDDVRTYVAELESGLWLAFKETKDGKDVAGPRYKTQLNLLTSSLNPTLRTDIREQIISRDLLPSQVAVLGSADLASQGRHEELEQARRASLQQTVRGKEDTAAIRLGRDGFEKVEDVHETELRLLARQEEAARERERRLAEEREREKEEEKTRRESVGAPVHEKPESPRAMQSPMQTQRSTFSATPRRESEVLSPSRTTVALTSAWGGGGDELKDDEPVSYDQDQALDLSDIVPEPEADEDEDMVVDEPEVVTEAQPVWSGGIINPAATSSATPPAVARLISDVKPSPNSSWSLLLPHSTIALSGRVPTKTSLKYIADSRLNTSREVFVVCFMLDPQAAEEEIKAWENIIEYHVSRDRHAIYHPYGTGKPPRYAAKELYLVPLRPSDPIPDFTSLFDGFALEENRPRSVFLGVFIANRESAEPTPTPMPVPTSTIGVGVGHPLPAAPPAASIPNLPNDQLQALMASLNPSAIQSLLANPPPAPAPAPVFGATPPYLEAPPYPPQGYNAYNPPPPAPYPGHPMPPPPPRANHWEAQARPPPPPPPPPQRNQRDRSPDRFRNVPRDLVKLPDTPTTPHRGLLSTLSRFIPGGSPSKPRSTALPGASERQEAEQVQLQEQGQGEVDTQLDADAGANEAGLMPSKEPETEPDVMITVDGEEAQAEGRGPEGEPEVSDEDAEEGAEDEYEVELIVDHRVGKPAGKFVYLVSWKGYGPEHNTWEPEENVEHAQELLHAYWSKQPKPDLVKEKRGRDSAAPSSSRKAARMGQANGSGAGAGASRRKAIPVDDDDDAIELSYAETHVDPVDKFMDVDDWEDLVDNVDSMERVADGSLSIYLTMKTGERVGVKTDVAYKRCPQKILAFYESHLKWSVQTA